MEGDTSTAIAEILKASRSKVSLWLQQYAAQGVEGLLEGHRSGHPCALTPPQLGTLADILDSGPIAYGFMSGVWTSPMIGRVIQEEFGVEYYPGHVRKLLYRLEFSVQRPKRLLARADERQQSRWRRYLYPRIKKSL
jgi:transposase